jgi:hypothetical protein
MLDAKEPVGNPVRARASKVTERALQMMATGLEDGNSSSMLERPN